MSQGCLIHIDLQEFPHFYSLTLSNTFLCNSRPVFWLGTLVVEILSFSFCLVNSECGTYLVVDHSLVYSYPKMFLLNFSVMLTLKPSFAIYISVSFSFFLPPDVASCRIGIKFPQLVNLVLQFLIQNEC